MPAAAADDRMTSLLLMQIAHRSSALFSITSTSTLVQRSTLSLLKAMATQLLKAAVRHVLLPER